MKRGTILSQPNQDGNVRRKEQNEDLLMQKISNFVDQIRIEHDSQDADNDRRPKSTVTVVPRLETAQKRMEHTLVEAEKFRATVEKPPGTHFQMIYHCHSGLVNKLIW